MTREGRRGSARWRVGAVLLLLCCATAVPAPAVAEPAGDRSWTLTAARITMTGLRYHGVVTTDLGDARVRVLSFTADELWGSDLTLKADQHTAHPLTITAPSAHGKGAAHAPIELLALRLSGTLEVLLGIGLPIYLTPNLPPPLVPPTVTLTGVTVVGTDLSAAGLVLTGAQLVAG